MAWFETALPCSVAMDLQAWIRVLQRPDVMKLEAVVARLFVRVSLFIRSLDTSASNVAVPSEGIASNQYEKAISSSRFHRNLQLGTVL